MSYFDSFTKKKNKKEQLVGTIYALKYFSCHPEILLSVTPLYKPLKALTTIATELGFYNCKGP